MGFRAPKDPQVILRLVPAADPGSPRTQRAPEILEPVTSVPAFLDTRRDSAPGFARPWGLGLFSLC